MIVKHLIEDLQMKFAPNAEVVILRRDGMFEELVPLEYCVEHEENGKVQAELVPKV